MTDWFMRIEIHSDDGAIYKGADLRLSHADLDAPTDAILRGLAMVLDQAKPDRAGSWQNQYTELQRKIAEAGPYPGQSTACAMPGRKSDEP